MITLPSMHQSSDMGLDSLYCGKWRKNSKSHCQLDLDRTIPNVELVRAIYILQYVQVLSGLDHYFLSYHAQRYTDTQTVSQTDMSTL